MNKIEFQLETDYIELIKLLKLLRIAESGGQAKMFVDNSEVIVNDNIELRKRAKIRQGDIIEVFDYKIEIK